MPFIQCSKALEWGWNGFAGAIPRGSSTLLFQLGRLCHRKLHECHREAFPFPLLSSPSRKGNAVIADAYAESPALYSRFTLCFGCAAFQPLPSLRRAAEQGGPYRDALSARQ